MKRRRGSGKRGKKRRALGPKVLRAPTARVLAHSPAQFDRLMRERDEALGQLAATSEVLRVISNSPGELEPVFRTTLEQATRVCDAKFGIVFRYECGLFHAVAWLDVPPAFHDFIVKEGTFAPKPGQLFGRLCESKAVINVIDRAIDRNPSPSFRYGGARSSIAVPMLNEGGLVGALFIYRTEVRPFTDKQIELVKNFAAQAVIAIENTRLLNELRESLQQQTATADVLKVISSTPGELQPVFETMLENAVPICGAKFGNLWLCEGNAFRVNAMHGAPPAYADYLRKNPVMHDVIPGTALGRIASERQAIQISDAENEKAYAEGTPFYTGTIKLARARTIIAVPLLKDEELVGAIVIFRQEVRPFTDKQIELVTNFAAQAVIAIENTRLLSELRESLQQQTATADVLKVISSTPGELEPVFNAMLNNATRICEAKFGILQLSEGDSFRAVALHDVPPAYAEWRLKSVLRPGPEHPLGRLARTKQTIHVADILAEPQDARGGLATLAGARTILNVPMLKENQLIGTISIYRQEVLPFTDKQIELVQNFAAQAVIAIENARLLNELRQRTDDLSESLEQQTATSEVLRVISSSPGELESVFNSILDNAVRICGARFGNLALYENGTLRLAAMHNAPLEFEKLRRENPVVPLDVSPLGAVVRTKKRLHVIDLALEKAYARAALVKVAGARSMLAVPMLKDDELIGAINIYRQEVRPFTDKQIALLENFGAQAVIAIENTRLLNELRQRTNDLSESLEQQTATSEILEVISNSPTDTQPAFDAIVHSGLKLFPDAVVTISLPDRDLVKLGAIGGADEAGVEALRGRFPMPLSHEFITGTAILDRREIDLPDAHKPPKELTAGAQNLLAGGYSAMTVVPMVRGDETIGSLNVVRRNPGPLLEKQRELLRTFANQAVIAIENTRLFNELRESLQQQTTTADVLQVISRS